MGSRTEISGSADLCALTNPGEAFQRRINQRSNAGSQWMRKKRALLGRMDAELVMEEEELVVSCEVLRGSSLE